MSLNTARITRNFSTTETQDIATAFATVDTIFDFHQGVSPQDIPRLLRLGTNNMRFVGEVKTGADDMPWLLPGFLDKADFDAEYDLYYQLENLESYLESLSSRVHQTKLIVGHHVMRDSLDIYGSMQHAVRRGVSGVLPYLKAAEVRFEGQGNNGSAAEDENNPPTEPTGGSVSGGNGNPSVPVSGGNNPDAAPSDPNMGSNQGS